MCRVTIKFPDSRSLKRIGPGYASDRYEWQQYPLASENERLTTFSPVARLFFELQTLQKAAFRNAGAALRNQIHSERAE
jgi:hypothetical protein